MPPILIVTSKTFTGTFDRVTHAVKVPPTPPPLVVAVKGPIVEPGPTGTRVNVTGTALEMLPALPSFTSLIDAQSVIGPAVPPGEFTCTIIGFEADGVMRAVSLETVNVLDPLLLVPGLELL
jgi:hypothetical protein